MNKALLAWLPRILLLHIGLSSCAAPPRAIWYVQPQFKELFQLNPSLAEMEKKNLKLIWQSQGAKIAIQRDYVLNNPKNMVMVSYNQGGALGKEFRSKLADPQLVLLHEPKGVSSGYALFSLDNDLELHGLAAAVHRENHPVCGGLELLNLSHLTVAQSVIGPVYSELLALPEVTQILPQTSTDDMQATIKDLEKAGTRYHSSTLGQEASQSVADHFSRAGNGLANLKVDLHALSTSPQKSVVAVLPGSTEDHLTVVLGAHLDSINGAGVGESAPGADDDASGIATLKEILRIIAKNNLQFKRRIEFHAYGAEEVGLFGSNSLAQSYAKSGRKVAGMMQFDMNAWSQSPGKRIYLVKNDTQDSLRKGTRDLLHTYFDGDYEEATLTAGTSDHKSWTSAGYPAVFPFENPRAYNRRLHTAQDTTQNINNLALSERMVHLGLTFLAHYGGLTTAEASAKTRAAELRKTLSRDLKIAVKSVANSQYEVSVATSLQLSSIEICPVDKPGGLECKGDKIPLNLSKTTESRKFFGLAEPIAIAATGQRFGVFGLNAAGKTVFQRSVLLNKKSAP